MHYNNFSRIEIHCIVCDTHLYNSYVNSGKIVDANPIPVIDIPKPTPNDRVACPLCSGGLIAYLVRKDGSIEKLTSGR